MPTELPKGQIRPFRVAVREEGDKVNAYWAPADSMAGARLVASIDRDLCTGDTAVGEGFMLTMQAASLALIRKTYGDDVVMHDIQITAAPEHEKAGRA